MTVTKTLFYRLYLISYLLSYFKTGWAYLVLGVKVRWRISASLLQRELFMKHQKLLNVHFAFECTVQKISSIVSAVVQRHKIEISKITETQDTAKFLLYLT